MCNKTQKFLCGSKKCSNCFNRSFASCSRVRFWSERNLEDPRYLFKFSNEKYWFECDCGHPFPASLDKVSSGRWCPFCCKTAQKFCLDGKCTLCLGRSFAPDPRAICWSDKNDIKPRFVSRSTDRKFWFNCDKCPHDFEISPNHISQGQWCCYCASKKLCDKDCETCLDKSFQSHPRAQYWSSRNKLSPRQVFKYSQTNRYFVCENGHEFEATPSHIQEGKWCPKCRHKTEAKLCRWLENNDFLFTFQAIFKWCKNRKCLPFDFLIDNIKVIIELDGRQHFRQVSNWQSPEEAHERDLFKTSKALENGYSVIRVLQEDVLYDKNDWESKLTNCLYLHKKPTCIFITNKNEYDKLKKELKEVRDSENLVYKVRCC